VHNGAYTNASDNPQHILYVFHGQIITSAKLLSLPDMIAVV
jgi:hypothetical protein